MGNKKFQVGNLKESRFSENKRKKEALVQWIFQNLQFNMLVVWQM